MTRTTSRNFRRLPRPLTGPVGEGFTPLGTNRLLYKADQCHTHALQGVLLTRVEMPSVGGEREWSALVVRATQPSVGVDREGALQPVERGDEVLVPVTHVLECDLKVEVISRSTEWIAELYIKPMNKIALGGGKTLWQYDARMAAPRRRTQEEALYNLVGGIAATTRSR